MKTIKNKKTILVAPLNWGLGHATRCIPVVHELLKQGVEVILAGSGNSLKVISEEFPQLRTLELPDYKLHFNAIIPLGFHVALQSIKLRRNINLERLAIDQFLASNPIDGIISDNRYGVVSAEVPSVMITHQLKLAPKTPFRSIANNLLKKYLTKFDAIWVPDEQGSPLSGQLSDTADFKNKTYLGILSRFKPAQKTERKNFILVVLSGTEPHRTIFENRLIKRLGNTEEHIILMRGMPRISEKKVFPKNFTVHEHLKASEFEKLLHSCKLLISRSGYSTIMDIATTETPAILVPTKGQSEQEYLAKTLAQTFQFPELTEKKIHPSVCSLAKTIKLPMENSLNTVIGKWLNQL